MKSLRFGSSLVVVLVLALAFSSLASAQATRTWVSGVGDDANPCSRTAPCKTFAGAISKTAAGGEIDCLDPGGFGAVTITKSMTIDCTHVAGGVLSSGANGITINTAGASDVVVLRNLVIQGAGTGLDGIKVLAGANVHLDNVTIKGVTLDGIEVAAGATVNLSMNDCVITDITQAGVSLTTSAGTAFADLNNVRIYNAHPGIRGNTNSVATVANSDLSFNGAAIKQTAAGSSINVIGSQLNNNGTALQSITGSTINAAGNTMARNTTAVNPNGGTISSDGLNNFLANGANGAFNGAAVTRF
ncbi:MAG: right-handed parallel beta-helix repeat-containing protein [Bryobacteraceae bacterium]|jgi:hypothetical protein